MKELVKVYPRAYLQIVSIGRMYEVLKRFVSKLKLEDHVELLSKSKAGVICAEGDVENLCKNLITTYEESESYKDNAIHFAKEHTGRLWLTKC